MAGHDVKTAPPDGFRQRVADGFRQVGRRLTSIVTALPGRLRLDAARRSTRSQLTALFDRLDLGDVDSPKLGVEIARLARDKQQWMQKAPDDERQFGEMVHTLVEQRWPQRHILHIEQAVNAIAPPKYAHLPEPALRDELAGLVTARADDYRAAQGLKARHKNEIQKMGFAMAREIAGGIFWKGSALGAAVKAYDNALEACHEDRATEADYDAARASLEEAGNQLLAALEADHPQHAQRALAGRYHSRDNLRAAFTRPRNQAQADLHAQFTAGYSLGASPSRATVVAKSKQADALRMQVARDEPLRLRGSQRTAETQYFRELNKQRRYLDRIEMLAAADHGTHAQAFRAALDRLPTSAATAVDYSQALDALHETLDAADRMVEPLVADTIDQVRQLQQVGDVSVRAAGAQQLVANTNDAVLMRLPLREQLALLRFVRSDLKQPQPAARSKLYMAMALDPQLLSHDKQVRHKVVDELRQDKKLLQDARDLWHIYTPAQKREVIMKVAAAHSRALGCAPPRDVVFTSDSRVAGFEWRQRDQVIVVGTSQRRHMDFEDMMSGVFHENSHNWQFQLVEHLKGMDPAEARNHPLHSQAMMFAANMSFYQEGKTDYLGYRSQPVEAHAYRAGNKLGAELMRMLAS